jgi:hypothetical protein
MPAHLRVVKPRTLADLKRLTVKGATLTVVKSDTLPLGLTRTVTRVTRKGYYYEWTPRDGSLGDLIADQQKMRKPLRGYATWPYARDVEVLSDHAYTVRRNGAEITWSIRPPS